MSKLIFGCGYLGKRVAKLWRDASETVHIVTRSADRAEQLQFEGFQTLVADVSRPESLTSLPSTETVLFAVGFDRNTCSTIGEVYAGGVLNVRTALPSSVEHFLYISSTGVYGPAGGDWVDENTPPNPQRDGSKASLAAEQNLGKNSVILRFGGIYGPDRIPHVAKLRAGEPIAAPGESWLNLIHVDDGAAIVVAVETWAKTQVDGPHIFCVCDGRPVVRSDYYQEVACCIGAAPPQLVAPHRKSPAAARATADKRVFNLKLKQELKYEFVYPSYREGLAAILGTQK